MNYGTTIKIFLSLLLAIILFHLSVITKIVPYTIAWGGRLQNDAEMYISESISILFILLLGFVLLMKGEYVKFRLKPKILNTILWMYLILFLLNTIGNIFAKTNFEKTFALLTFIFVLLIWSILKAKHPKSNNR